MRKQSEEYRANMLRKLKNKYGGSNPPEVLEAEKVIAKFREKQANAIQQITRLESSECPDSVCCECFYERGLSFHLKSIPGGEDFDSFRCPECGATYKVPSVRVKGKITTIDSKKRIGDAWKYIEDNCAKSKDCNDYFSKLSKKMTLTDILKNVTFTVYHLIPKEGHKDDDLPMANSAGQDFALSIWAFLDQTTGAQNTTPALAATILHEIAHYAGATTYTRETNSLEAENALIPCGLKRYYNPDAKG